MPCVLLFSLYPCLRPSPVTGLSPSCIMNVSKSVYLYTPVSLLHCKDSLLLSLCFQTFLFPLFPSYFLTLSAASLIIYSSACVVVCMCFNPAMDFDSDLWIALNNQQLIFHTYILPFITTCYSISSIPLKTNLSCLLSA